jgi:hypothetical protein
MQALPDGKPYELAQLFAILDEFGSGIKHYKWWSRHRNLNTEEWLKEKLWDRVYPRLKESSDREDDCSEPVECREFLQTLDAEVLQGICHDYAREFLADYLRGVCLTPEMPIRNQWYCPSLVTLLIEMLDILAGDAEQTLAQTEVRDVVFDGLAFTLKTKGFTRIDGNSRYGKSESIRAWCQGRPGLTRLMTAHCMPGQIDFFQSFAEPLGIPFDRYRTTRDLRLAVERVLRVSKLMIVVDEAHNLFMGKRPVRLEWLRTCLVDRHIPSRW